MQQKTLITVHHSFQQTARIVILWLQDGNLLLSIIHLFHLHSVIQLLTAWIAIKVEIIPVHPQIVIPVIRPIFRQPQIPIILSSGFATTCQTCHTTNPGWKPASFNHTVFPLTLGHATPACTDCHKGGNYTTTPTDCYACHQPDYAGSTNPNHVASGFPTACLTCHTTNPGWKPASFNHTTFPLTQGHSTPACIDCHKNGNYTTISTDCYSCHSADYNNSTNPNHKTLGFCHSMYSVSYNCSRMETSHIHSA